MDYSFGAGNGGFGFADGSGGGASALDVFRDLGKSYLEYKTAKAEVQAQAPDGSAYAEGQRAPAPVADGGLQIGGLQIGGGVLLLVLVAGVLYLALK